MRGDALASGSKTATFGGPKGVTQKEWDERVGKKPPKVKPTKPTVGQQLREALGVK